MIEIGEKIAWSLGWEKEYRPQIYADFLQINLEFESSD